MNKPVIVRKPDNRGEQSLLMVTPDQWFTIADTDLACGYQWSIDIDNAEVMILDG